VIMTIRHKVKQSGDNDAQTLFSNEKKRSSKLL